MEQALKNQIIEIVKDALHKIEDASCYKTETHKVSEISGLTCAAVAADFQAVSEQ